MKLSVLLFGSIQGYLVRRNRRFLHGRARWSIIIQHSLICKFDLRIYLTWFKIVFTILLFVVKS
jgi:hypothetical protein